jgi:hypothetical protein
MSHVAGERHFARVDPHFDGLLVAPQLLLECHKVADVVDDRLVRPRKRPHEVGARDDADQTALLDDGKGGSRRARASIAQRRRPSNRDRW